MRPVTIHIPILNLRELTLRTLLFAPCISIGQENSRPIVLTSLTLNTSRYLSRSTLADPRVTTICVVTAPMKLFVRTTRVFLRVLTFRWPGSWRATSPCVLNYSKKRALAAPILKFTNQMMRYRSKKSWSPSKFQTDIPLSSFRRRTCARGSTNFGWLSAPEMAVSFNMWSLFTLNIHLANL